MGNPKSSHFYIYSLLIAPSLFPDDPPLQRTRRPLSELAHEVHTDGKPADIELQGFSEIPGIYLRIQDNLGHSLGESKRPEPLSGIFGFVDIERRIGSPQQLRKRVKVSVG